MVTLHYYMEFFLQILWCICMSPSTLKTIRLCLVVGKYQEKKMLRKIIFLKTSNIIKTIKNLCIFKFFNLYIDELK